MSTDLHPGWRPKRQEVASQCASCPFRVGNNVEFGEVANRLRRAEGIMRPASREDVGFARLSLFMEAVEGGDFACHCSVYNADMSKRPMSEWRQCKGATQAYQTGKLAREAV